MKAKGPHHYKVTTLGSCVKWPSGVLHTMAEGREVVDFHISNCKKPRVRPLDPSRYGQSPKAVAIQNDCFLKKVMDSLEGRLGRMGMETQTMVERPSVSFHQKSITHKILAVRLEGLFWARNEVGCSFGFGLWAWPLDTSHYGRPSRDAIGLSGQRFGLWAWPLEAWHYARPKAPLTMFYWLCIFSSFLLISQQSLATQSHNLSTWTAIMWSFQRPSPKSNSKEHATLFLAQNNPSNLTTKILSMIDFLMKKTNSLSIIVGFPFPSDPNFLQESVAFF
jgi:hypothetical protein